MSRVIRAVAIGLALIGCSSSPSQDPPAPASGSASGSAPGSASASATPVPIDAAVAPAPVITDNDLDAAVMRVFEQWKARQLAAIRDGSHPTLRSVLRVDTLQRMYDTMHDAAGDFVKVEPPFEHGRDPDGDPQVTGKAIYAKGALTFKLSLRGQDGVPLLTDFNLSLPKELQVQAKTEDAVKLSRQMLDGLLKGKVRTELVDPSALVNMASTAEVEAKLKSVVDKLGTVTSISQPLVAGCGGAQCISYDIVGAKTQQVAVFEVGFKVRKWWIRSFDIGKPAK